MEEEGETTRSTIARLSAQRSALSAQRPLARPTLFPSQNSAVSYTNGRSEEDGENSDRPANDKLGL